jgi:hypothetical protein
MPSARTRSCFRYDFVSRRPHHLARLAQAGSYILCLIFLAQVDTIDVSAVKRSLLLNVGLLHAALKDGDADVIEINLVTQVTKDATGGLVRTMFNPLE